MAVYKILDVKLNRKLGISAINQKIVSCLGVKHLCFFILILSTLSCKNSLDKQSKSSDKHVINFEVSKYGLLLMNIQVDGKKANALIDLGDPNVLQLSTSFVEKNDIPVKKTGDISSDVQGNTFELYEGTVKKASIAGVLLNDRSFLSGYQELEHVSRKVKTKIDAVVGWGFFKTYNVTIDYREKQIMFSELPVNPDKPFVEASFDLESQYLVLKAKLDSIESKLILDTGSAYTVLDSSFFHSHDISFSEIKVRKYLIFSMIFKRINTSLGNENILIDYYIYDLPELSKINADGILGGTFFKKYIVHILPNQQKVFFQAYSP